MAEHYRHHDPAVRELIARERAAALREVAAIPTPGPAILCKNPGERDDQWRAMLHARADREDQP